MDTAILTSMFDWLQQNPVISLLFVFLVACGESLAVVGLIVPGALLMVGFGALIARDYLAFWPTVIAAILGSGLSHDNFHGPGMFQERVGLRPRVELIACLVRGEGHQRSP